MRRRPPRILVLVAALGGLAVPTGCAGDPSGPGVEAVTGADAADYVYVIPDGTGALLDQGVAVDLLPARLDARIGEVIRIENDDERGHTVGPFFVAAHQVLTQRFSTAGTYVGACKIHPSGQFELTVTEA